MSANQPWPEKRRPDAYDHHDDDGQRADSCGAQPAFYNTVGVVAVTVAVVIGYAVYSRIAG